LEQVAEYKGKIKPSDLGLLAMAISKYYGNGVIAIENNSGWAGQAILKIQEAQYPYLYYSRKRKTKVKQGYMPDPYMAERRNDFLPGYAVTSANRNNMLSKMEEYIRLQDYKIYSKRLVEEFKTFVVNAQGKPEAQRGYNDDLVMALAGGLWVRDESFLNVYKTDEYAKAMLAGMSHSKTTTGQFKDFNYGDGGNYYDRGRVKEFVENQNKIVLGNGDVEDLSWLISSG